MLQEVALRRMILQAEEVWFEVGLGVVVVDTGMLCAGTASS